LNRVRDPGAPVVELHIPGVWHGIEFDRTRRDDSPHGLE
jgi:hypothetical protein